jgi:hypothetical protein
MLFADSMNAQGLQLTEIARWELPASLIPEYIVDADEHGFLVGQRGATAFWVVRPDGVLREVKIQCAVRPWFVGGHGKIVGLDSATKQLAEIDPAGRCVRTRGVVTALPIIRDIAVTATKILLLSSDRGVRPDSIAVQRFERRDFRENSSEVVALPQSISRPVLDEAWSGWQVVDRRFPYLYVPVDSLLLAERSSEPGIQSHFGRLGFAVDSLWVALPTVRVGTERFIRTLVDLRRDARVVVQRDCRGLVLRVTKLDGAIGIVLYREASKTLIAVQRTATSSIVSFEVRTLLASAPCNLH